MSGRNDAGFRAAMEQGHARYRTIGTREMRILDVRVAVLDPLDPRAVSAVRSALAGIVVGHRRPFTSP